MANLSNEEILNAIAEKSVTEIVDLIKAFEERFGVSASVMAPVAGPAAATVASTQEEKTDFDIVMTNFGNNKIGVIKVVREITSLGLKEAKDLVEGVPAHIKDAIKKEEAEKIKKQLEEAGATVELK